MLSAAFQISHNISFHLALNRISWEGKIFRKGEDINMKREAGGGRCTDQYNRIRFYSTASTNQHHPKCIRSFKGRKITRRIIDLK